MTTIENILRVLGTLVVQGANNGLELEQTAKSLLQLHKCEPAFLGYQPHGFDSPYPNILCVSINGEVIHGIPDDREFEDGDVVKIDIGLKDENGQFHFCQSWITSNVRRCEYPTTPGERSPE